MAAPSSSVHHRDLFTSLISDIKSYSGKDPLLPWLRGIKKMKECLPPNVLKEKLPRFLQKCAETFQSDRRYRNDLRYLRVWLQLMDYVDDPRLLLRTMEMHHIGTKSSLFYQAYGLYYEKMKKFEEAEKMYCLGVRNLAEPLDELQKSYEEFLHRMKRHKNKKAEVQAGRTGKRPLSDKRIEENSENACITGDRPKRVSDCSSKNLNPLEESNCTGVLDDSHNVGTCTHVPIRKERAPRIGTRDMPKHQGYAERNSDEHKKFHGEDTVVVKFVDTAIVGKSEAEDSCHHGLVDATINMKEAMNTINSMFRQPLETAPVSRKSHRNRPKEDDSSKNGLNVFVDETLDNGLTVFVNETLDNGLNVFIDASCRREDKGVPVMQRGTSQAQQPSQELLQIFVDDEGNGEGGGSTDRIGNLQQGEAQNPGEGSHPSASHLKAFVFPSPRDLSFESSNDLNAESSPRIKLREDTVVHRFVGSTILEEPAVENVCHHGLVDPTINLKEAMDDINNMFGKPIDFVRTKRTKKQDKASTAKEKNVGGFSILPDENLGQRQVQPTKKSSGTRDADLFEPTVFTKEAMDEINKMFGMPLDF